MGHPTKPPVGDELLDLFDVCDRLHLSPFIVSDLIRSGRLPATRTNRLWHVKASDLEAFIAAGMAPEPDTSPEFAERMAKLRAYDVEAAKPKIVWNGQGDE